MMVYTHTHRASDYPTTVMAWVSSARSVPEIVANDSIRKQVEQLSRQTLT